MSQRSRLRLLAVAVTAALPVFAFGVEASAAPASAAPTHPTARSCPGSTVGAATCHAIVRTDAAASATPSGYGPSDLRSAYNLPSATAGSGQTVAIVDAYDGPTAEADLGVYRAQFGIPACTTANGCFKKVNQTGGTKYPRTNGGWAQEISLDLDMVSAICPNCHITLVEASSNSFANLGATENEAASLHPSSITTRRSRGA